MWMLGAVIACREGRPATIALTVDSTESALAAARTLDRLGLQDDAPPVRIVLDGSVAHLPPFGESEPPYHPLDIEVDGQGTTLLPETELVVRGARVSIHDLRHPGRAGAGFLLTVEATISVDLADLHLANAPADDRSGEVHSQGGAIEIVAGEPLVRVVTDRVTVVDARGGPTILFAAHPPRRSFGEVVWRNGRFGGSVGPEIGGFAPRSFAAPDTVKMGAGALVAPGWSCDVRAVPEDPELLARWRVPPRAQ